jgi:hypothetical protein
MKATPALSREANRGPWWGTLKDRGHLEDPDLEGRIIF